MKLTKDMLDKKIKDYENDIEHEMTFREWIKKCEDFYELENEDLDSMSDEELQKHDNFLLNLMDK